MEKVSARFCDLQIWGKIREADICGGIRTVPDEFCGNNLQRRGNCEAKKIE
jgi:hypothetical protein